MRRGERKSKASYSLWMAFLSCAINYRHAKTTTARDSGLLAPETKSVHGLAVLIRTPFPLPSCLRRTTSTALLPTHLALHWDGSSAGSQSHHRAHGEEVWPQKAQFSLNTAPSGQGSWAVALVSVVCLFICYLVIMKSKCSESIQFFNFYRLIVFIFFNCAAVSQPPPPSAARNCSR